MQEEVSIVRKGWLYGYEVMREWQVSDTTLMQWLLNGLPAYSPNSLKRIEKHLFEKEGLTTFCEWETATLFRTYSVEGLRLRLLSLIFIRPEIEAAAAGMKAETGQAKGHQKGKRSLLSSISRSHYTLEGQDQTDWTFITRLARKVHSVIERLLKRF